VLHLNSVLHVTQVQAISSAVLRLFATGLVLAHQQQQQQQQQQDQDEVEEQLWQQPDSPGLPQPLHSGAQLFDAACTAVGGRYAALSTEELLRQAGIAAGSATPSVHAQAAACAVYLHVYRELPVDLPCALESDDARGLRTDSSDSSGSSGSSSDGEGAVGTLGPRRRGGAWRAASGARVKSKDSIRLLGLPWVVASNILAPKAIN